MKIYFLWNNKNEYKKQLLLKVGGLYENIYITFNII
jgi:hypothetical protein